MTAFIQKWNSKTLPTAVLKEISDYSQQDVVFVPEDTIQKYEIAGEIQSEQRIDKTIPGINYHLTPGKLIIGQNLTVLLR